MAEVNGGRLLGRPKFGWMDVVKLVLGSRGMTVAATRNKDRKEWRALVHMWMIEFQAVTIAWFLCSPHVLWWLITWKGERYRYVMLLG